VIRDFAEIWPPAEKIVFSRTLQTVASAQTHIERTFDPDAVRRLKEAAGADTTIRGCRANRPGESPRAGRMSYTCSSGRSFAGGGKRAPPDHIRVPLALLDERQFRNGVVHLHCRVSG
jgi:hypothetical protein